MVTVQIHPIAHILIMVVSILTPRNKNAPLASAARKATQEQRFFRHPITIADQVFNLEVLTFMFLAPVRLNTVITQMMHKLPLSVTLVNTFLNNFVILKVMIKIVYLNIVLVLIEFILPWILEWLHFLHVKTNWYMGNPYGFNVGPPGDRANIIVPHKSPGEHTICDINGNSLKLSDVKTGMLVKIRAKNVHWPGYEYLYTADGIWGKCFAI